MKKSEIRIGDLVENTEGTFAAAGTYRITKIRVAQNDGYDCVRGKLINPSNEGKSKDRWLYVIDNSPEYRWWLRTDFLKLSFLGHVKRAAKEK